MKNKILVIGSLNRDMTLQVENFPQKGESIFCKSLNYSNGGKGANQAVACARAGASVTMLGCVGNDENGKHLLQALETEGIDTQYIHTSSEFPTGMALINVTSAGDNNIIVVSGANQACSIEYLKRNDFLFQETDCVLLQLEVPLESVEYCINRSHELNKMLVLNPAPVNSRLNEQLLEKIDYIIPNEEEFKAMLPDKRYTFSNSAMQLIVTLGDKGCEFFDRDLREWFKFPSYKVNAIDTVAAGDSFIGYFTFSTLSGRNLQESIQYATAAAALAVTKKGAQESIPDIRQVEQFIKEGGSL